MLLTELLWSSKYCIQIVLYVCHSSYHSFGTSLKVNKEMQFVFVHVTIKDGYRSKIFQLSSLNELEIKILKIPNRT
jgi:hypothetical protein